MAINDNIHTAYANIIQQNFRAYNRGDMYVPAGSVQAPIANAINASPWFGPMHTASVPILYTRANANARPRNKIGMSTPNVGVDS